MLTTRRKPILIFDWDGVIVDSNDWKWDEMWREIFPTNGLSVIARNILKTKEGRSLTRYELIRRILLEGGLTELSAYDERSAVAHPSVAEALERFRGVSLRGVLKRGLFKGARDVLNDLKTRGYSLYVITGTAHDDIMHLALEFNVVDLFKGIYGIVVSEQVGGAINKEGAFQKIILAEQTSDPDSYIVVGDGESDRALAENVGCRFVGVVNRWNGWEDASFPLIRDLTELPKILDS